MTVDSPDSDTDTQSGLTNRLGRGRVRPRPITAFREFLNSEEVRLLKEAARDSASGVLSGIRGNAGGRTERLAATNSPSPALTPNPSTVPDADLTSPDDHQLATELCIASPTRTTTHDGTQIKYALWRPKNGSGVYIMWRTESGDTEQYATLSRAEETDTAWLNFNTAPDGFPNRIELSETDTIAEDYYNIITGATQYSAAYHSDEVDVDIDRDAFDAVPDSAEVTGKLTVGKAQTQTLTLPILIQPWKPAGSDAVYFAWKLGRDTGSKGTLNAQVLWLGESGATVSDDRVGCILLADYVADDFREQEHRLRKQ